MKALVGINIPDDQVFADQHTWTRGCDGLHKSGPCPAPAPQTQVIYPGTAGITHLLPK